MSAWDADAIDLYALGLLEPDEAARLERDMEDDPALAAAVAQAQARFAPIDDTADPVTPTEDLWRRIEASLGPAPQRQVPLRTAARTAARRTAPAGRGWRAAALGAMAASVALAATLGWRMAVVETPEVVAVLLDSDRQPVAIVEDFGDGGQRVTPLANVAAPDGSTFQVWTKYSEEVGPVSLGVLDALRTRALDAEGLPPPQDGQLYEITIEGPGGSPTGLPTGPIVGIGLGRAPR